MANPLPPATSGQGLCFQLGPDHTFYRASPEPWTGPKESLRVLLLQPQSGLKNQQQGPWAGTANTTLVPRSPMRQIGSRWGHAAPPGRGLLCPQSISGSWAVVWKWRSPFAGNYRVQRGLQQLEGRDGKFWNLQCIHRDTLSRKDLDKVIKHTDA